MKTMQQQNLTKYPLFYHKGFIGRKSLGEQSNTLASSFR